MSIKKLPQNGRFFCFKQENKQENKQDLSKMLLLKYKYGIIW